VIGFDEEPTDSDRRIMSNELETKVNELSYTELVEAANFYFPKEIGTADTAAVEAKLTDAVTRHGGDYHQLKERLREVRADENSVDFLLRTALLHADRCTPEQQQRLRDAIAGVGQSQVVVELLFAIFAATTLGLTWLAVPPQEETVKTSTEKRADGTEVATTERTTKDIPPPVEKLFGWIKGLVGSKG
jgi:hypothetical protein